METIHETGDNESDDISDTSSTINEVSSTLDATKTTVIVAYNVLPVNLKFDEESETWSATWSEDVSGIGWSGNKSWESAGYRRVAHVGVPNAFVPLEQQDEVERLLEEMECYPVYLGAQEASTHYQGYVKGVLHPTFHNIIDLYNGTQVATMDEQKKQVAEDEAKEASMRGTTQRQEKWAKRKSWHPFMQEVAFPSHMAVTTKFARVISQIYHEDDVIWVHDYHLLHLPSLLIRKLPQSNVGLFLHQPFPSSEIFRTLSYRMEILRSMLCADHIGFHQFEYARHFLTCCRRMLGVSYTTNQSGSICVPFQGRFVTVTCCHAGVEAQHLSEVLRDERTLADPWLSNDQESETSEKSEKSSTSSTSSTSSMKIIGCVDTAEGMSGMILKMLAFDRFLEERPRWRAAVTRRTDRLNRAQP